MTIVAKHTFKDLELSISELELVAGGIPPELLDPHTNEWENKPMRPLK